MHVGYSRIYESFEWSCIYGCHATDYESRHEAEQAFLSDPQVQRLMRQQGASLVPDSIRPYDEG